MIVRCPRCSKIMDYNGYDSGEELDEYICIHPKGVMCILIRAHFYLNEDLGLETEVEQ